jgi:acetyl-CoA decarbonylase/synthase complex subunit beta
MNLMDKIWFYRLIENALANIERLKGFEETEFINPILFGVTSQKTPRKETVILALERLQNELGGYFLDALWLAELVASESPNRSNVFISDSAFRRMCVGLNEGTNGWALIVGQGNVETLRNLVTKLIPKRFRIFTAGATASDELDDQVNSLGSSDLSIIYFAQLLVRYALIYGRARAGDPHGLSHFIEDHAPSVVFVAGELSSIETLLIQGLLSFGVPALVFQRKTSLVGAVKICTSIEEMVQEAWRLPNIRARSVEVRAPHLPVPYSPRFAREELSEDTVAFQIGGTPHSFFVVKPSIQVHNDEIHIPHGWKTAIVFGLMVELGHSEVDMAMTYWIESVFRRVINYAQGVKFSAHGNSEAMLRLSKEAVQKGFTLEHLDQVIIKGLRNEFPLIGPIKISFSFDMEAEKLYTSVQAFLHDRVEQIKETTDENIPFFYGCTRCRSFSLAHACTVTPERPSQCGSRPWYRLKAQAILAPASVYHPSQIIDKGRILNELKGEYEGVNTSTAKRTEGRVARVFLHSIFNFPHTACSCFQNIAFYMPEVDGIGLMHRGYGGSAPNGATWNHLANLVAGRQYREGAASFSVNYVKSSKFFQGDGGWDRIVWMTKYLQNSAGQAIPDYLKGFIATEEVAVTMVELKRFLTEKGRSLV